MIITVGIIYRILYEFSTYTGEVAKKSGLYNNMSNVVDFYTVQVVKHNILLKFYHGYGENYHYPNSFSELG